MADSSLLRAGASVSIGRMDGRMQNRRLVKFSPSLTSLALEPEPSKPAELLATHELAYVAFLRTRAEPAATATPPPPPPDSWVRLSVHVAGGKVFDVMSAPPTLELGDGFFAIPTDEASPFSELYFYRHAVNALESREPLGQLLIRDGLATADEIARSMQQQNARLGDILVERERVVPEAVAAAVNVQERKRLRLGEVLLEAGLVTPADIESALAEQKLRKGKRIGEILVDLGILTEQALAATLAKKFHLPFVDLDSYPVDRRAAELVSKDLIRRYGFLPVGVSEDALTIAISDPLRTDVNDVLRFTGYRRQVLEVVVAASQLKRFVDAVLQTDESAHEDARVDAILSELASDQDLQAALTLSSEPEAPRLESDSAVIRLANQIIIDGLRRGASDIHIEPRDATHNLIVRFRVDGDCELYQEIPPALRASLVARFKIMASLDIAERRKPQDGKLRFAVRDRQVELRVATIPTVNGNEDMVLRILAASRPLPLEQMGLSSANLVAVRALAARPYGLVLCVGPTGSGKTTTLHSILGSINTIDMKIWTAEDPVEITQDGLRQVQVQPKIGFTFAQAMRAFLRADPDVIMVGEMRDQETAQTAIEASLTGHLVLSTLHTNSAPETVTRLLDMGLDPFTFADALLGVLAQRLTRALCSKCRVAYLATPPEQAYLRGLLRDEETARSLGVVAGRPVELWRAPGCATCGNTGYKGRLALHELLVTDDGMIRAIQRKAPVDELRALATRAGMRTLLQDGIAKALAGHTDLRQVTAVCSR